MSYLLILFLIPFFTSLLTYLLPSQSKKMLKQSSLGLSLIPLFILIYKHSYWIGSEIDYNWIPALSIHFHLKIDALSLVFLYLTAFILPFSILAVNENKLSHPYTFYTLILALQGLLIGLFMANDLVLFTIFWEAVLFPIYFIMNLWGGEKRQQASMKFLIYMIAGSSLMVAGVLGVYFLSGSGNIAPTFNLNELAIITQNTSYPSILGIIFLLAFAVKTPLFPFHGWLADAYCQSSTSGTLLLAGLLSKAGIYGFLRIGLSLFQKEIAEWNSVLLTLSITGVLYGGLLAWQQNDFKRLIAFSSFSHVNFILVGIFALSETAHLGAIIQSVNHAVTITALFLISGWLETRLSTTSFNHTGGLAKTAPILCWVTLFFVLASIAVPGTNNFVGELLIFFGLFGTNPVATAVLGLSIILSVIYMLNFMRKIYFEQEPARQIFINELSREEMLIATPLIAIILWIGIYPLPLLELLK